MQTQAPSSSALPHAINLAPDPLRGLSDKARIYVFVRTDLTLPQQAVQLGHAAAEAGSLFYRPEEHGVASLILLQLSDLAALHKAQAALAKQGIVFTTFNEPDQDTTRAEGTPVGLSAIGTRPMKPSEWAFFRKWRLWNGAKHGLPLAREAELEAA